MVIPVFIEKNYFQETLCIKRRQEINICNEKLKCKSWWMIIYQFLTPICNIATFF